MNKNGHISKVSMPWARDRNGRPVSVDDLEGHRESWPRPLRCYYTDSDRCTAQVVPVGSVDSERRKAPALFRLWRGHHHGDRCYYNLNKRIDELVEDSEGVLVPDRRTYRLVLPSTYRQHRAKKRPDGAPDTRPASFTHRLRPVLNTAAKVQHLIDSYSAGNTHVAENIAEHFGATCNGRKISWDAFYYTPATAWRLAHRLSIGLADHPAAVAFQIQKAGIANGGNSRYLSQDVPSGWLSPDETPEHSVAIRSRNLDLLQPYQRGGWVLALGLWELFRWDIRNRVELSLWIDSASHLTPIDPPHRPTITRPSTF